MRGVHDVHVTGSSGRVPTDGSIARPALVLLVAALPWAWFALRDLLGVVGDTIAIVLPVLVVVAALLAVVVSRRAGVLVAVSFLAFGTVAVAAPWRPADAGAVRAGSAVTVASANVTGMRSTLPALRAVDADVLVVAENDPAVDAQLAKTYPDHLFTAGTPSVGVYSRFALKELDGPGPDLPGMRVAVAAPVPFTLYALHVPRPWWTGSGEYQVTAGEHHRIVSAVAARAQHEPGPVVLAGDFNSTDRGRDYRNLTAGLVDAMRDGWIGPTSVTTWRLFLLRIDHLLVSPGWCGDDSRRFDLPNSDHDGITATVGPCAT
jgi:endonuclease/exonuclease/phosphatase (EEP) superfamily protein YafD